MMRTTLDVAIAKPGGVPLPTRELDAELRVDLDHADRLLESFLTLARAQNGQLGERTQVALEPLITAALTARADEIAAKRLTVETQLAAVEVTGSTTLLGRMVENVIENAVRHNQPGGSIELTLGPADGRHARLTIDSSGPVLDQDAVAQLAQPFKRLRPDRTGSQNGHGLGLSIVAAVAAAHDGRLDLHARAEGGLRVQITLPAATHPTTRAGHTMRVLVVEDMPRHANRIAEGLRDQGIAVDVAYDGHEAVSKLNLNPYDVVLLDRDLPGIHGDQLCQIITHIGRSADGPDAHRRRRPHRPRRRARARRRRLPPQALPLPRTRPAHPRARPPQTHRPQPHPPSGRHRTRPAHRHRHPRRTNRSSSPRKNAPCSKPCSRPAPAALSAERLLEQAWDENVDPFTNTVKVTIARLRRKLGQPDIIHTTPGVGYRITEAP